MSYHVIYKPALNDEGIYVATVEGHPDALAEGYKSMPIRKVICHGNVITIEGHAGGESAKVTFTHPTEDVATRWALCHFGWVIEFTVRVT